MVSSAKDPATGYPIFQPGDAPDTAGNPTEVAKYAAAVGTRLIGTTAERLAYPYEREGLAWFDTTLGFEVEYVGGKWRATHQIIQRMQANTNPTTVVKGVALTLPKAIDPSRNLSGTIEGDASSAGGGTMIVGTLAITPNDAAPLTSVTFRIASVPTNFGSLTAIKYKVVAYPWVAE